MSIFDRKFYYVMSFLIENNIIEIENSIYMAALEESEMITSLNEQIEKLRIENDEIEKSKDTLEEEFMKKESETQTYYEQEIENQRLRANQLESERNDFERELVSVKRQLEVAQTELTSK